MKYFFFIMLLVVPVSACVSLEVKPKHLVSDTVDASKDLYKTVTMKTSGQEERKYSYVIPSESEQKDGEAIDQCFSQLKRLANGASKKEASLNGHQSEITIIEGQRSVKCTVTAMIKPKN